MRAKPPGRTPDESRARQGVELIAIRWTRFPNRRVARRPAVEFVHEVVTPDGPAVQRVSASRAYKWVTVRFFEEAKQAQRSVSGACICAAHDRGELAEVKWTAKNRRPNTAFLDLHRTETLPVYDLTGLAADLDIAGSVAVAGIRDYVQYRRDQLAGPKEVKPCRS